LILFSLSIDRIYEKHKEGTWYGKNMLKILMYHVRVLIQDNLYKLEPYSLLI
jgi:hypothetical protein